MQQAKALDVDFKQAGSLGNELLERIDRLREAEPVYWSELNQCWIISGHAEVAEALRGELPFSNRRAQRAFKILSPEEQLTRVPYLLETFPQWLIDLDPPAQTRMRRLMMKAFSRKIAEDLRPYAREVIKTKLDLAGQLGEVDMVNEITRPIAAHTIFRLLGLDPELITTRLPGWMGKVSQALGGFAQTPELLEDTERTLLDMRGVFAAEIENRRVSPRDDFISALVTAQEGDDALTDEEVLAICYLTLLAGIDTTAGTMAMGAAALAELPEAADHIRDVPDAILDHLMELQRYIAMSTMQPRTIGRDFEWRGHQLRQGQVATIFLAGANRDPKVFPEPDQLKFDRPQEGNMTFGPGLHFCIGHLLAKMQLTEFFPELLRRFDMEVLDQRLDFTPALAFRGLKSLRIRVHPRAG